MGKEVELSATTASIKTQVKSISVLVPFQSKLCGLFRELSVNKNLCGPESIQVILHMLSRSELIFALHVI